MHPLFGLLFVGVPLLVLWIVGIVVLASVFRKGEPILQKHANQVTITESRMEFGQDHCGPTVAVVGKMKNSHAVDWRNVCFQVEFFDSKGSLVDAAQKKDDYSFTRLLPAGQELGFQISIPRQFPEKNYASHKIRHSLCDRQYARVPRPATNCRRTSRRPPGRPHVVGAGDDGPGVGENRQLVAFDFEPQEKLVAGELAHACELAANSSSEMLVPGWLNCTALRPQSTAVRLPCGRKARGTRRACRSGNRPDRGARGRRSAGSGSARDRRPSDCGKWPRGCR